jgi:hypothetical protein
VDVEDELWMVMRVIFLKLQKGAIRIPDVIEDSKLPFGKPGLVLH